MKLPKELRDKNDLTRVGKVKTCSVKGCSENAIRSLSENTWKKYLEKAHLKFEENRYHKIYLCKAHYNQSNKFRKSQEKIYQKKGFLENATKKGIREY
ncbi:MAG: hypothetical protein KAT66_01540 [Candidatus Lokiarchaeota archaeon]|nr:hypothetical protein [Candidatus Lokiarchaeota archaeon]